MGRHVSFYAIECDYVSLLRAAQNFGLLAIPRIVPTVVYDLGQVEAVAPLAFQFEAGSDVFYLVPQEIPIVEVFYRPMRRDPSLSLLMPHVSPVIECSPCHRQGKKLYHSRLYINAPHNDPWSPLVYKAYKRLTRHIRKWPKVEKSTHVGPVTFDRVRNGDARLMVFSHELEIK